MSTTQTSDPKLATDSIVEEAEFRGGGLKGEQHTPIAGDVVMISGSDKVRRVPIPSDDPNDPLHFAQWRKIGIIFTCCWYGKCCSQSECALPGMRAVMLTRAANFSLLSVSGIGTFFHTLFEIYAPEHRPQEVVGLATYSSMVMAFGKASHHS